MAHLRRTLVVLASALCVSAGLTACSSTSTTTSTATAKPVYGGTLMVVSDTGPGNLDPVPTYNYAGYELERGYAEQLLTYEAVPLTTSSGPAWTTATTVVAGMATEVPSQANGGISANGLTYTYHIRPGVDWNSSPPRQVTAEDFISEFKAFCNPTYPVGNVTYFNSAIAGFASYCSAEDAYYGAKHAPTPTPANLTAWTNSHSISGLSAPNPLTLQVTLTHATSDFNNIMAMPFVSARPIEYDNYLPGSAQLNQHMMSDGPYQVSSYIPNKQIVLTRNPSWKQSTDPVLHQYVDKVVVTLGTSSDQTAVTDIEAGTDDLFLADLSVPAQAVPALEATHSKQLKVWPSSNLSPYIVFNLRSPNTGGAMGKLAVRQAIEYGVDKAALQKLEGGPQLTSVLNTAIPPGNVGAAPSFSPYPTAGNAGDTAKCKSLLASAGYPHGLTLNYLYPNDSNDVSIFQSIQGSLSSCGITLKSQEEPAGGAYFTDLGNTPQTDKAGTWDMATGEWFPDWFGNNGRTTIQPVFETNCTLGTVNAGCYSSTAVDGLINQALAAPSESAAAPLWHQADVDVMQDAAIVPLLSDNIVQFASSRVHTAGLDTANFSPAIQGWDFTNIWLSPTS
jgi:peptide/nickel transport system substrate-binding protein